MTSCRTTTETADGNVRPYHSRPARIAALTIRILLGMLFIVSAVAKWVDIDNFEVHVFSYQVLSLNVSLVVARLIIIAELLVGIGLVSNVWHRFVNICAVLMLVGFTFFLGYAALMGRTDSCQCMGPLVEMNPVQSMVKNAVLLVLLWVAMHCSPWRWSPRWWLWVPVVLAPVVAVFVTSAPDNWLFGPGEEPYRQEALHEAIGAEGECGMLNLDEGRHVVAFVTAGCQFCRMADRKITSIFQRHDLDTAAIVYLMPALDSTLKPMTRVDTAFLRPAYVISKKAFLEITYGNRPVVMLMNDGEVEGSFHYRNIDETRIVQFMTEKQ